MSNQPQETSRWGLIAAGLAIAGGIFAWDWANRDSHETPIVEPVAKAVRNDNPQNVGANDFVASIAAKGIAAAVNPVVAIDKRDLQQTVIRPMFSASRRLPVAPLKTVAPPPKPPPPPNPDHVKLVGVMVGRDGAVALIRIKNVRGTVSVRQGEIIDGWKIEDINSREMKIQKENVAATVTVSKGNAVPPPSLPPRRQ